MGCANLKPGVAPVIDGKPLEDPIGKIAGTIGLVPRTREHATRIIVLENAGSLIANPDEYVKLSLLSHPGYAIIPLWATPHGQWMEPQFIDLGVGQSEVDFLRTTYDGNFFTVGDMVFEVPLVDMSPGNVVRLIRDSSAKKTREVDMGRDFTLNEDGTICPKGERHLVLGIIDADNTVRSRGSIVNGLVTRRVTRTLSRSSTRLSGSRISRSDTLSGSFRRSLTKGGKKRRYSSDKHQWKMGVHPDFHGACVFNLELDGLGG